MLQNDGFGHIDLGGAYVGPTQDHVKRVADELGVATQLVLNDGEITCYRKVLADRLLSNVVCLIYMTRELACVQDRCDLFLSFASYTIVQ